MKQKKKVKALRDKPGFELKRNIGKINYNLVSATIWRYMRLKVIEKIAMKTFMLRYVIIFICISAIASGISAQDLRKAKLDTLMRGANKLGLFNGNLLVHENGKILYNASFGNANASGDKKLDAGYRFNIGSIAKEFNAVGIMMLKEQGKLSLSDQVSKFIPELPNWADSISVLNLLQYTSGIPDSKWKEVKGDSDNLEILKKIKRLDFSPGTKYAYNNNNTFLQRRIIEKASGMTFSDFVRIKMLQPLGMRASLVDPNDKDFKIARSYNNAGVEDDLTPPISGWTSVTAGDFYKWAIAISNYKLINPASTREILTGFGPGNQAGLGGGTMQGDLLLSHIHDGTTRNYQALLVSSSNKNRVVILLTNNQQNNLYSINRSIQFILDGQPYAKIKKSFLSTYREKIKNMNGEELISYYAEQRKSAPDDFSFDSEDSLNEIGYSFLRSGKAKDAILIFIKNTELFPNSGNVFDSLAEAYLNQGDKGNALKFYKKSLSIDPGNSSASQVIKDLEKGN